MRHERKDTSPAGGAPPGDPDEDPEEDYLRQARWALKHRDFDAAEDYVRRALASNDASPAAHNLRGVLCEVHGDRLAAQNSYRDALNLDATYAPARFNLRNSVDPPPKGSFVLAAMKRPEAQEPLENAKRVR